MRIARGKKKELQAAWKKSEVRIFRSPLGCYFRLSRSLKMELAHGIDSFLIQRRIISWIFSELVPRVSRLEAAHCLRLVFTSDIVGVVIIAIIVFERVLMTE